MATLLPPPQPHSHPLASGSAKQSKTDPNIFRTGKYQITCTWG